MTAGTSGADRRTGVRAIRTTGLRRLRGRFRRFVFALSCIGHRGHRQQANACPFHQYIHGEKIKSEKMLRTLGESGRIGWFPMLLGIIA